MPADRQQGRHAWPEVRILRGRGLTPLVALIGAGALLALISWILREEDDRAKFRRGAEQPPGMQKRPLAAARETRDGDDLGRMRQIRRPPRQSGWAGELRNLVRAQTRLGTSDPRLRLAHQAEAVAAAAGLDAWMIRQMPGLGAYFVISSRSASKLLLGGVPTFGNDPQAASAKLLIHATPPALPLGGSGMGPVAFRDETPLQLLARPGEQGQPDELALVDLQTPANTTRFEIPGRLAIRYYHELGLAADGSAAAAPVRGADGTERLVVWSAGTARPRFQFPQASGCVALSADGSLVAAGDRSGAVRVWSLSTGRLLTRLTPTAAEPIRRLAFGPLQFEPRRDDGTGPPARPVDLARRRVWALAFSDAPGRIRIRSIRDDGETVPAAGEPPQPLPGSETICQAPPHEIAALAFSTDGTLLASCGDDQALLWDPLSGQLLLSLKAGADLQAVAFSPLGANLAVCSAKEDGSGMTSIWGLRDGGAIKLLRGATARFTSPAACPDPKTPLVAAWARDGRAVVWTRWPGLLQHTLPTPLALENEQPVLAFSPDGSRLAFNGGGEAVLWDLASPEPPRRWPLGRQPQQGEATLWTPFNALCFPAADRLIAMRVDSEQILHVQNLLAPEPRTRLAEVGDLGGNVTNLAATPDGSLVLVTVALAAQPGNHALKAYHVETGELAWSMPLSQPPRQGRGLQLTPDGKLLAVLSREEAPAMLIEVATGEARNLILPVPLALGPDAQTWIAWAPRSADDPGSIQFCNAGQDQPAFSIPANTISGMPTGASFTADGQLAIWVNADNTVAVCDLAMLRRRLEEDGLAW